MGHRMWERRISGSVQLHNPYPHFGAGNLQMASNGLLTPRVSVVVCRVLYRDVQCETYLAYT